MTVRAVNVRSITQRNNTENGNPRYTINTGLGAWLTEPDNQNVSTIDSTYTGRANITVNNRGLVTKLEPIK